MKSAIQQGKKRKVSIVFADSNVDIISNEKHHQTVTKLSIRKLNVSLVFILQSYSALKDVRQKLLHLFVTKIANRREVQQIGINHSINHEPLKIAVQQDSHFWSISFAF